jgi:hypothetical protein
MSPVRYELGSYISEDGILHSHRFENLYSYFVYSNVYNSGGWTKSSDPATVRFCIY